MSVTAMWANNTDCLNQDFSFSLHIFNTVITILLSGIHFLGIIGNGLVIWFVTFRMKKTVNCVWFLSLAVADFTFCLFLPLVIILRVFNTWPFGPFMCKLYNLVFYLNLSASVLQLTVIAFDRCISVVFPVWCRNRRNLRLAVIVVLVVWIISLLLNVPYLKYMSVNEFDICTVDPLVHKTQVIIRLVVMFVIPFIVIIFCYTVIFLRVRSLTSTRLFKIILALIISFFICWFPFHVTSLLEIYGSNRLYCIPGFIIFNDIAFVLSAANSFVNPLLYVFVGQSFREEVWSAIKSAFEKGFTEDTNLSDPKPGQV